MAARDLSLVSARHLPAAGLLPALRGARQTRALFALIAIVSATLLGLVGMHAVSAPAVAAPAATMQENHGGSAGEHGEGSCPTCPDHSEMADALCALGLTSSVALADEPRVSAWTQPRDVLRDSTCAPVAIPATSPPHHLGISRT